MSLQILGLVRIVDQELLSFLSAYRATRLVLEFSESLPQTTLQSYIFARTVTGCTDFPVDFWLLIQSLAASLGSMCLHAYKIYKGSRVVGLSIRQYTLQLFRMGAGVPLHAIANNKIANLKVDFALDRSQLEELFAALQSN